MSQVTNCTLTDLSDASFMFPTLCRSDPTVNLDHPLIFGHLLPSELELAQGHHQGVLAASAEINHNNLLGQRDVQVFTFPYSLSEDPSVVATRLAAFIQANAILGLIASDRATTYQSAILSVASSAGVVIVSPRGAPALSSAVVSNPSRIFIGGSAMDESYAVVRCGHLSLSAFFYAGDCVGLARMGMSPFVFGYF